MDTGLVEGLGVRLCEELRPLGVRRPLVLALPPGGVPLASLIAERLGGDLDIIQADGFVVAGYRGAVAETGEIVLDDPCAGNDSGEESFALRILNCLERMLGCRARFGLPGTSTDPNRREVIVVADVLATGSRMVAALESLRRRHTRRIIAAVVTGRKSALARVGRLADGVVCLELLPDMSQVGRFSRGWPRTPEAAAIGMLARFRDRQSLAST